MKNQNSGEEPKPSILKPEKKKRFSTLQIILTLYGLLYILFIIDFDSIDYLNPYNHENIVVNLAFILFLVGYFWTWRNKMVAGIIFIFWWIVMWSLGLFIAEHDGGSAVAMGLPLFILGVLFIVSWYKKK